jgi:WD40 repeat protein
MFRLPPSRASRRSTPLIATIAGIALLVQGAAGELPRANADDVKKPGESQELVSFRGQVWPILKRHCWGCHSGADPQGGLKMDSVADMLKGGEQGPLYVAGKPEESRLIKVISGANPEMPQMQPPLSAAKIELLRRWIAAGARDDSTSVPLAPSALTPVEYKYPPAVTSVTLSADGKRGAAACRSEVVLFEVEGGGVAKRIATECDLLTHVEFSPAGDTLAVVGGSPARFGEVKFIRVADASVVSTRRLGHDTLFRGNFSPDGKSLAIGGADGAVYLIPVEQAAEVRKFDLHTDWVMDVAFAPDGKTLVSGGRDKATKISSVETGLLLRAVDASPDIISGVATDGLFAVSSGRSRTLIGYEYKIALSGVEVTGAGNGAQPITKRDQYTKPFESQPGEVLDMAASGDRKVVAVAGLFNEARVYRIADRQRIVAIPNVPAPIYSVALDATASRLALGAKSGRVLVYELPTGKLVAELSPLTPK